jgi:hypothetical protein
MLTRAIRQIQAVYPGLVQAEVLEVVVGRGVAVDVTHPHEVVTLVAVAEPLVTAVSHVRAVKARSDLARSPLALAPQQRAIAVVAVAVDIVQPPIKEVRRVAEELGF